jgi:hypothetical protein
VEGIVDVNGADFRTHVFGNDVHHGLKQRIQAIVRLEDRYLLAYIKNEIYRIFGHTLLVLSEFEQAGKDGKCGPKGRTRAHI